MTNSNTISLTIRKADKSIFESLCKPATAAIEEETPPWKVALIDYKFNVNNETILNVEKILQTNRIPYDKILSETVNENGRIEFHRVKQDGKYLSKSFLIDYLPRITINDLIKANQTESFEHLLDSAFTQLGVLSWADQHKILEAFGNDSCHQQVA